MYKSKEMLEGAAPVVFVLWTTAAHYLFGRKMGPLFNTSSNMFTPGKVKVNFICSQRMAPFWCIWSKRCKVHRKTNIFKTSPFGSTGEIVAPCCDLVESKGC